jgi:hypothetical protein
MPTMQTSMCSGAKSFLNNSAALRAILTGVVRWHSNRDHAKYFPKILNPLAELSPRCITNRLRKMPILHHVPHLQVLIRHQIVRLDYAPCRFNNKVFTLATYLEVFASKLISELSSVFRPLLSLGQRP